MNTLERQVLEAIGEDPDSPDVFLDTAAGLAPIRDSLNAAVQELSLIMGLHTRTYHLALLPGRQVYRLGFAGWTFGWVSECWDRARKYRLDQASLKGVAMDDPRWLNRTGYPTQYIHLGEDHLAFDRAPTAGGVLELSCVLIPSDYSGSEDPVQLRTAYERAAVHYAVSEFHASRGSASHAEVAMREYLDVAGIGIGTQEQAEKGYAQK